jgi:hypothetical protein
MRKIEITGAAIGLVMAMALPAWPDDLAAIKQALEAKYSLTTTTADKTDIVTAGAVLVLKKTGLVTVDAGSKNLYQNVYQNGRISQKNSIIKARRVWDKLPGATPIGGGAERDFVSGEKVWVTGIEIKDSGVLFNLFTDAYKDTRYAATLRFPFQKDATPSVSGVTAQVAEVFDVQPSDAAAGGEKQEQQQGQPGAQQQAQTKPAAAPQPSAEAPPPPIAPPPPPPADPKEIKVGQTPDQVVGNFGQPDKVIKLASKQIYVYKDMKVTFVGGKVSDVQ